MVVKELEVEGVLSMGSYYEASMIRIILEGDEEWWVGIYNDYILVSFAGLTLIRWVISLITCVTY